MKMKMYFQKSQIEIKNYKNETITLLSNRGTKLSKRLVLNSSSQLLTDR